MFKDLAEFHQIVPSDVKTQRNKNTMKHPSIEGDGNRFKGNVGEVYSHSCYDSVSSLILHAPQGG